MRERAADQRLLELLLEPIADGALAARQRLRELAVERLRPIGFAVRRRSPPGGCAHLGRQVGDLDALPGRHHREPVADVLELAHVAGERERA